MRPSRISLPPVIFFLSIFISLADADRSRAETEPNDTPDEAQRITIGTPVEGIWHQGDPRDCFKLQLPTTGIVKLRLSGYPSDCTMQVGLEGFQKSTTNSFGAIDSKPGKPIDLSFVAQGGYDGTITIRLAGYNTGKTTKDWAAVRCSPNGPWYVSPYRDGRTSNPPAADDGIPIRGPIKYRLEVSHTPLIDAYEHTPEVGVQYPELLAQGKIKTIPIGQEISAYLLNPQPGILRDESAGIDSDGGENDTDIYHIAVGSPDTLRITTSDIPEDANFKIRAFYPNGWKESETGAAQLEFKLPHPGDVFIEITRGDAPKPLCCSTTPYRLAVTTGSTGHTTTSTPGDTPAGPPKIVTGPPVSLGSTTIGLGGGEVVINRPGDPLNGFTLDVPAGSYPNNRTFDVSYEPIESHRFGPDFKPISPLITVKNGGDYSEELMTLRIPIKLPAGHFAMPFYYDPATGQLEGIPVVALDNHSVTAVTRHFSKIAVASEEKKRLETVTVDTGYRPGVDDWQFKNIGTHASSGGRCAGMTTTSIWHWNKAGHLGSQYRLWGRYDGVGPDRTTPGFWQDDSYGHRLTSVIQKRLNFSTWQGKIFAKLAESNPKIARWCFQHAMLVTKQPQFMGLHRADNSGHAVVAYKIDGDTIYVADPSYAGDASELRRVYFEGDKFKPYKSARTSTSEVEPFEFIGFFGRSSFLDWSIVTELFTQMWNEWKADKLTIGDAYFEDFDLLVKSKDGGEDVVLTDGYYSKEKTLDLEVRRHENALRPMVILYRWRDSNPGKDDKWDIVKHEGTIELDPGINRIGVCSYFVHVLDGKRKDRWNGFKWLKIYHYTLEVDPSAQKIEAGTSASFRAIYPDASKYEFGKFSWRFEDSADWYDSTNPTASHTYTTPGEYEVIARFYDEIEGGGNRKLLADGRALVIVTPSETTPTPTAPPTSSGITVHISHNAGGRLQTGAIGPAQPIGTPTPGTGITNLTDLTGGRVGQSYSFKAQLTGTPPAGGVKYVWSFGGAKKEGSQVDYAFSSAGNHDVTVEVVDASTGKTLASDRTNVSISP